MGKNTIATTTATFEDGPNPNHITKIGAVPTMGKAAMKLPTGIRPRCKKTERSMASAARTASAQPIPYPTNAPRTMVCIKSAQSVGMLAEKEDSESLAPRHVRNLPSIPVTELLGFEEGEFLDEAYKLFIKKS